MRWIKKKVKNGLACRALFAAFCFSVAVDAAVSQAQQVPPRRIEREGQPIRLEVFCRSDSELSAQAERYATGLGESVRGLEVVVHDVIEDRAQLKRLWQLTRKTGRDKAVVPTFHCCNRLMQVCVLVI